MKPLTRTQVLAKINRQLKDFQSAMEIALKEDPNNWSTGHIVGIVNTLKTVREWIWKMKGGPR